MTVGSRLRARALCNGVRRVCTAAEGTARVPAQSHHRTRTQRVACPLESVLQRAERAAGNRARRLSVVG